MSVLLKERATPGTPTTTYVEMYSQGKDLYAIDSDGRIVNLTAGGVGVSSGSTADRVVNVTFGSGGFSSSKYLTVNGATFNVGWGLVLPRNGSVTALTGSTDGVVVTAVGPVQFSVLLTGTTLFFNPAVTIAASGKSQTNITYPKGMWRFAAGDQLQVFVTMTAPLNASILAVALVELTYD